MCAWYERYAVCWIPPSSGPLSSFGLRWTGWCPDAGEKHRQTPSPLDGLDLRAITAETSRHGFHGLLERPFRLRNRSKVWLLERTLHQIADETGQIAVPRLGLGVVDGRVALVPEKSSAALDRLSRRVRDAVAPFAAVGSACADSTSVAIAEDYGVAIRPADSFHMPLTDRLPLPAACQIAVRLRPILRGIIGGRHSLAEIALLGDPGTGRRARVEERYALAEQTGGFGTLACRGPRTCSTLVAEDRVAAATV